MLRALNFNLTLNGLRLYCVKAAKKDVKKYTDTINLPKTKFPSRLSASKREEQERQILDNEIASTYGYQERHMAKKKPTFVLHDGPPYANGQLHMGHAVNKILKDITLRQRVAHGQQVNYIPGWDCHGLPIELKATNATGSDAAAADPLDIRQKSRKFALEAVKSQKDEFRSWGILANWQRDQIYMTFQPEFIANQLKMFYDLYEQGLVYRDLKPVYWSPSSRTALAEAELEYNAKHISPSVYLRFKLNPHADFQVDDNKTIYALVWTTTPWTLPSNQAICYNSTLEYVLVKLPDRDPNDLYLIASALVSDFEAVTQLKCEVVHRYAGSSLAQLSYHHPIDRQQSQLPFFDATHVQDSKGTGLVHTAPAHGPDDFLICLAKKIPVKCFVDEAGIYTKEAPAFLIGQSVLGQGNSLVLQHIAKDVVLATQLEHSYPIDWRTKEPVIVRASEQWFINTEELKAPAAAALAQVEIYPRVNSEASKKALLSQLQKRPYWCISRQRAWGVPIPVLYRRDTGKVVVNRALIDHLCARLKSEGNMDFWWSSQTTLPDHLVKELNCDNNLLLKGKDIFDIWFDSGSTWSAVLPGEQVADLYLEGYDQFTGWFQSSLLTSIAARKCAPYKTLFVHGFTVDEKGHKMSKSLGNVISPKQITKKYGTDVLRWWVASHGTQNMSITVSDKLLQQSADNVSKIRGILRYLNGVIGQKQPLTAPQLMAHDESYLNKYLLSNLLDFEAEIESLYNNYEYNRVVASIQNFIVNQVSSTYVHLIKDRLYCGHNEELTAIRQTLTHCYRHLCKALWPIIPFLVEESWGYYDASGGGFHNETVLADPNWRNAKSIQVINAALDIKRLVNQQAGDVNSWLLEVAIECSNPQQLRLLRELDNSELCEILQVGAVALPKQEQKETKVYFKLLNLTLCPRCRRYGLQPNDHETCSRCSLVLKAME